MNPRRILRVTTRSQWRAWLKRHHATGREVWLVSYKRHTGRPSIPYGDALDEALCFGWIDSLVKFIDEERFARKFTPRRPGSVWSEHNRRRVARLLKEGRLTPAGKAVLPQRGTPRVTPPGRQAARSGPLRLPQMVRRALRAHPRAEENFRRLAPSHQRNYVLWVMDARREETRSRRLKEVIGVLLRNIPLGLK